MIDRVCSLLRMAIPERNRGLLFSSGPTVPTDATDGYQTGCIFQHTDGSVEGALYVNEGSVTSCDFNAIIPAGEMELSDLSDVGTVAYSAGKILVADGDSYEEVGLSGPFSLASDGSLLMDSASKAAAGSNQSDAVALNDGFSYVTAADGTKGAKLINAVAGEVCVVTNTATATGAILKLYPNTSNKINAGSANASIDVGPGSSVILVAYDAEDWRTVGRSENVVSKTITIPLSDLRCENAAQTLLPATPDGNGGTLGLGAAAGSPVLGSDSNSGVVATQREYAMFDFVVPADYVAGQDISVTIAAYVSDSRDTASPLDVIVKHIKGGALDGTDLQDVAAIDIKAVVATADHVFNIDSDSAGDLVAPGSVLNVLIDVTTVDTAEAANGHVIIDSVTMGIPCYR